MRIEILPAGPDDAGELMTLQRAAYLSEARLHEDFDLPPLRETAAEVRTAVERERVLKALAGTGYRRIPTPPGAEPLVFLEKRLSSA